MIRRTLRKIVPSHAVLPMLITAIALICSYQLTKALQLFITFNATDISTAFDAAFPFRPVWVWIYFGSYLFWIYQYTAIARESEEKACQLAIADAIAKFICLIFFVCFPVTNVRPEITGTGISDYLMHFLYWIDTPTNLFPSMHCFVSWLGTRYLFECKNLKHRWLVCTLCLIGTLLVFLSTLFTKQHVIWDVFAGIAVAEIGWLVARFTKLPQRLMNLNKRFMQTKLCKFL